MPVMSIITYATLWAVVSGGVAHQTMVAATQI